MWHSGSKCQRIGVLMKVSRKQLKASLALGFRNFSLTSVASKFVEFPLFDNFFLDLAEFQDLDVFLLFDFPDLDNFRDLDVFSNFLACFTPFLPIPNPSTSTSPSFLPKAGLMSSFLLEANLLPLFLLGAGLSSDPVVFSIEVSGAAILLKLWINRR